MQNIHGVLIRVFTTGVLIVGEARVGKSECALELISRGHAIVADDVVLLASENGKLVGSAPEMFRGLVEIRDLGIVDIASIYGDSYVLASTPIDLVVELEKDGDISNDGELTFGKGSVEILGSSLTCIRLRVSRGRNLSVLIETAVRMLERGNNSALETMLDSHKELLRTASNLERRADA